MFLVSACCVTSGWRSRDGAGGAYSTTLRGWARKLLSSYRRVAQHHAGEHAMGGGGCEGTSAYVAGEDVFILERSVMYTVNPCVGEGRKYVSIILIAGEDI